jgi:hypothetical protein
MTQDEANAIARVIETADGGCDVCIRRLCDELNAADLDFEFTMIDLEQDTVCEQDIVHATRRKEPKCKTTAYY